MLGTGTTTPVRATVERLGDVGAGRRARVPGALREAARFPDVPDGAGDAAAWARVLVVAAKELAGAARQAESWPRDVQRSVLASLDEVARLTAAAKAPVLTAEEASGAWRQAGVRSFADFRARSTRAGRGAARREVDAARAVQGLDGGLAALESGSLPPVHAERLGVVASRLPEREQAALLTGASGERVKKLAERFDATRFASKVEEMAAALSAQQVEERHQDARRRRHLELSPTADGMTRVNGLLDPVAGHTLQVALDAASPRPAADDDRTRGQRQADALHSLAAAMLVEQKSTGQARPHVLITMTAETFQAAREHLAGAGRPSEGAGIAARCSESGGAPRRFDGPASSGSARLDLDPSAGPGAALQDPDVPAPVVRLQDGPVLPLSELGRTLCDSQIARLVVTAESEPLDLGRSQRLFTPAQRRAVIARDGGCAWEGCTTPARYGEVHHLDWWDDDHGHTDVARGVLVCVFHHHELHRHNLDLVRVGSSDPPQDPPGPAAGRERSSPRYRIVPRAQSRARREEAKRARLLVDARASSAAHRAHRTPRDDPGPR